MGHEDSAVSHGNHGWENEGGERQCLYLTHSILSGECGGSTRSCFQVLAALRKLSPAMGPLSSIWEIWTEPHLTLSHLIYPCRPLLGGQEPGELWQQPFTLNPTGGSS